MQDSWYFYVDVLYFFLEDSVVEKSNELRTVSRWGPFERDADKLSLLMGRMVIMMKDE